MPPSLARLLAPTDRAGRDEHDDAWAAFLSAHSRVLLYACRSLTRDKDAAMDAYTFVLDALRDQDCRRLRSYTPDGRTSFSTWLVVVTRRLVRDHQRQRYGRSRSDDAQRVTEHAARRRLEDLIAGEVDTDLVAAPGDSGPDAAIRRRELSDALRQALDELTPDDRLLLMLRFVDARPASAVAVLLRMPSVFHVYRRQHVVLAALRRALARRGVSEPDP